MLYVSKREACASLFAILFLLVGAAGAGPLQDRIDERRSQREMVDDVPPVKADIPGVRVLQNVRYGTHPRQRFDVYLPASPTKAAPVVLMVHGGAWSRGDKAMRAVIENKAARWTSLGMILVSTNYRLLPDATPLEQVQDVARALALAQKKAAGWGGDRSKFLLMGHSAGAHLVSLLAVSPATIRQAGALPWLGTVALDSACFDLVKIMESKHYGFYDTAFGRDPAYWRAASPLHQLSPAGAPFFPLLAVCSSLRPDQPCVQARDFADKAQAFGMRVEVLEEALSHREINEQLGLPTAYTEAVEAFMGSLGIATARHP